MKEIRVSPHVIGQLINVSGRQRMLSQRITLFAINSIHYLESNTLNLFSENLTKFEESLILFEESHNRLTLKEPALFSESLEKIFHKTEDNYNRICKFIENCFELLTVLKDKKSPNPELVRCIYSESSYPLLKSLNDIVSVYEEEAKKISIAINHEREEKKKKLEIMIAQLQAQEEILVIQKAKLKDLNNNLEEKVKVRTNDLLEEKQKLKNIFDSIDQSIITVNKKIKIETEVSKRTLKIFKTKLENIIDQDFYHFLKKHTALGDESIDFIRSCFTTSLGESSWVWDINKDNLPTETVLNNNPNKFLSLNWNPACNREGIIQNIILTVRDISSEKELEIVKNQQNEKIQILKNIMNSGQQKIKDFITRSISKIEIINETCKIQKNQDTQRELHTIKGEARILGVNKVSESAHNCETFLESSFKRDQNDENFRNFLIELQQISDTLYSYKSVFNEYFSVTKDLNLFSLHDILSNHISNFYTMLAKEHIEVESIIINDQIGRWDPTLLKDLNEVFLHIFNNSADHGFILPLQEKGIRQRAKISVYAYKDNDTIFIEYSDNGYGLNLEKIQENTKLVNSGNDLYRLIFEPHVSTSDKITQTSGRGVGLNQVKNLISSLSGNISAYETYNGGMSFKITLPLQNTLFISKKAA